MRFISLIAVATAIGVGARAQGPAVSPAPQAPASAGVQASATEFSITGIVKSGNTPLPGVTITASNTLTGKTIVTSTDAQGKYSLQPSSRGRYVIKTNFPAFASVTKEVVINPATPTAKADLELVLLSRVPKATEQGGETQAYAGIMNGGRGTQSLSLSSTGAQPEATASTEAPTEAPSLANTADAGNGSVAVAGSNGSTQDFGRDIEDMRDRIEEMRARGELPGGGPGGPGGMGMMGGGPGGFGGRGGGGGFSRFNMNRPHGSLYYSFGNSALDAAPYSLSGAPADKPDYSSNRFGGTIGGPLPKFVDKNQKTFLFLNVTGTRATQPTVVFSHVPTLLERSGDFSQSLLPNGQPVQIVDPSTGLLTNKLTSINSTAAALLQYIPLPNQPGEQNFRLAESGDTSGTNIGLRVMHSFGTATAGPRRGPFGGNNINVGVNYNDNSNDRFGSFPSIRGKIHNNGLNANAGYTFSHGKLTNNLRVNFNRNRTDTKNLYSGLTNIEGALGITGVSQNPLDWGLPGLSFSGFTGLNDINPVQRSDRTFQVSDTVIWRHNKHNVRVGADFRHIWTDLSSNTNPRGSFIFTGEATSLNGQQGTGYDFADFLLGIPQQTAIQYSPNRYSFAENGYDLFVNDDWRVTSNVTLNLGLRYEYLSPFTEANNQLANLDAAPGFSAVAPVLPGQTGPYSGVFPASLVKPDRNNWAPRVGFAWKPFGNKTVVRGGYGINYNLGQYRSIVQQLAFQPPFSFTETNLLSATTPLTLTNGFPVSTSAVTNSYGIDPNYRLGYVQLWNLNIQRELPWNLVLNVGYIGSKGTALDIVRAPNRGPDGLLISGVQPFLWESSQGSSIMHGGTLRLNRRFSKGIGFGATYTFSKSIDNASSIGGGATVVAQNDQDLAAERGLSAFDQRQKLSGTFTFDLPFGEGRVWLTRNGLAQHLFGSWELSGTFNAATGFPFTARVLGNFADVARGTNGTLRADYIGVPIELGNPTVAKWFNTAAFTVPTAGQFGDAGRNTIIGPTTYDVDMSLSKSFQFKDTMGLEVRLDATNVFNMARYTTIDSVVNSPTFGQVVNVGQMRQVHMTLRYRF